MKTVARYFMDACARLRSACADKDVDAIIEAERQSTAEFKATLERLHKAYRYLMAPLPEEGSYVEFKRATLVAVAMSDQWRWIDRFEMIDRLEKLIQSLNEHERRKEQRRLDFASDVRKLLSRVHLLNHAGGFQGRVGLPAIVPGYNMPEVSECAATEIFGRTKHYCHVDDANFRLAGDKERWQGLTDYLAELADIAPHWLGEKTQP